MSWAKLSGQVRFTIRFRHLGELAEAVQGVDVGAADALVVEPHQRLVVELDAQHRRLRRLGHVRLVRMQRQRVALRRCQLPSSTSV